MRYTSQASWAADAATLDPSVSGPMSPLGNQLGRATPRATAVPHRQGSQGLANANASTLRLTPASALTSVFGSEPFRITFPALATADKYLHLLSHLWGISSRQLT